MSTTATPTESQTRLMTSAPSGRRARAVLSAAVLSTCLLAVGGGASAQSQRSYVHEAWTVEDGLPVNSINGLHQSRDGYMWAATFDGLVRFDGVRFTVFNAGTSEGLPSNRLLTLHEAGDGSLWLRTEQLHLVRFRDGEFTHFDATRGLLHDAYTIHEDSTGVIWVGTRSGLGFIRDDRFVPVAGQVLHHPVNSIIRRRDGTLWVGTVGAGLFRYDGAQATKVATAELDSAHIRTLYEDPAGTLWAGAETGVWSERGGWHRIRSAGPPLATVLKFINAPVTGELLVYAQSGVFRIAGDVATAIDARSRVLLPALLWTGPDSAVWHATASAVHRNGQHVIALADDSVPGLSPRTITSGLFDREGSLWLGTHAGGLHRLKPALFTVFGPPEGVGYRNVYAVHQDRAGDVWIGTHGNGLSRIDSTGRVTSYTHEQGYPPNVNTILQDRADRLLIGAGAGVFSCALPRVTCSSERVDTNPVGGLALAQDSRGRVWLGTTAGLFRNDGDGWQLMPASAGAPGAAVRVILETSDGALWLGTNGAGLVRYDDGEFTHITTAQQLPTNLIRSLYEDADGWLWIGTEGSGLARLAPHAWRDEHTPADRHIVRYRARDGLFDDVIHQILEDDHGRLWMSTNRGIFWVARAELNAFAAGRIRAINSTGYTEGDGLRNREANGGVQSPGIRARDGRLWFATQDGVAVIDPAQLQTNLAAPPVVIERLIANDSSLGLHGGAVRLDVTQRNLQIEYTGLSFLAPANVRFRYRLVPYDTDWVDAGSRRSAFYTRVPPGRYTFHVIASNNEGVWNEQGASLELVVAHHFWETGIFRIVLLLALGLLGLATVRWREHRLRLHARLLEHVVDQRTSALREREQQLAAQNETLAAQAEKLQELDHAKSRLFANLSHEFRTPLTLILGPLRSLLAGRYGELSPAAQEQGELMVRNSQRLLRLINQVLDLSRLQAREVTLDRRRYDLVSFARATTLAFAPLAERRGVALHFHTELPTCALEYDAEQLEKVLLNLLSNAFKFTDRGGNVTVAVSADAASVMIAVHDTGVGIPPEQLAFVFDRFYQADTSATRRYEGSGIGLALARELVELHGGEINAESTPGAGSTFTVRLPLGTYSAREAGAADDVAPAAHVAHSAHVAHPVSVHSPASARTEAVAAAMPACAPAAMLDGSPQESDDRTTVLIVDDNPDVRAYVRSVLTTSFRVIEAGDGRAGLERALASLPDLIVADVMMPELDGLALGRALKADPMTDAIPVILLTARAEEQDQVAGLETGADAYLVKPFDPAVLEAQVVNLLAQRRRLRERFSQGVSVPPVTAAAPTSELEGTLRAIVEAHLHDPGFGPDGLAALADMSYHQLYRALRQDLQTTPSRFIRTVRVDCAAELLRRGAGSVTEIAYSVGFESLSYFSRSFRERFGVAPTGLLGATSVARDAESGLADRATT